MFKSIITLMVGLGLSWSALAADQRRLARYAGILPGEYTVIDETEPLLGRRADGSLEMLPTTKYKGVTIAATKNPLVFSITVTEAVPDRKAFGIEGVPVSKFSTIEVVKIWGGDQLKTVWSDAAGEFKKTVFLKRVLSAHGQSDNGLMFTDAEGDDMEIFLEEVPKPKLRIEHKDREEWYLNHRDVTCTEIAAALCRNVGGEGLDFAYCAAEYEKECNEARASTK